MSFHNSLGMSNEGREVIDLLLLSNEIVFKSSSYKIVSQQECGFKNSIHITMAMVQFITVKLTYNLCQFGGRGFPHKCVQMYESLKW